MLKPHLLKGEDSVGERRVRAQFQELPGACIKKWCQKQKRHYWSLEDMKIGHELDDTGCGNVSSENTEELRVQSLV